MERGITKKGHRKICLLKIPKVKEWLFGDNLDNKENQEQLENLHLDFKRANGYSELEIANKRQSLENILVQKQIFILDIIII